MQRRDRRNTQRGGVRLRWVLGVVVLLAVVAAGAVVWRPEMLGTARDAVSDTVGDIFRAEEPAPDPSEDPAAVPPPTGLDLPGLAEPEPVARPVAAAGAGALDPDAVRRALRGPLGNRNLGPHVVAGVASLDGSSSVLVGDRDASIPASTTKVLTAVAALEALGPERRFATTVVDTRPGEVTLVGGGDPLLDRVPDTDRGPGEPARANLRTLARRTAAALRAEDVRRVRVAYDDSLFSGPVASPTWEADYLSSGVVSPITALWADRGVQPDGVRAPDPSLAAAEAFAAALRDAGIRTPGGPRAEPAPAGAAELARVTGMPVDLLVEHLVETSDNEVAEVVAHHVGLEVEGEGSFAAGARAVTATLRDLGVDMTGSELNDGSGLSRRNRLTATALTDALGVAAATDRPELRAALTGLPVAGFSGSLASRFSTVDPAGLGVARAKTGTLTGVSGLAGLVTTADGTVLAFSVVADRIDPVDVLDAIQAVDRSVAALARCRCGSPT